MIVLVVAVALAAAAVWRRLTRLQAALLEINAHAVIREAVPIVAEAAKPKIVIETPVAAPPVPAPIEAIDDAEVSTDLLLVISAAVAAFLGNKVHIRRVRLMNAEVSPWAQQGRAFIQASHNLSRT